MGSIVGKAMDENLKKNQEFMIEMQKVQLERQIQMQNQMRERMMSMQIAKSREFLYWFGTFYTLATFGLIASYRKSKNRALLAPIIPLTFIVAYQTDLAYGSKINRIKAEAENIMRFESQLLEMPNGLPTPASIDDGRYNMQENDRTMKSTLYSLFRKEFYP